MAEEYVLQVSRPSIGPSNLHQSNPIDYPYSSPVARQTSQEIISVLDFSAIKLFWWSEYQSYTWLNGGIQEFDAIAYEKDCSLIIFQKFQIADKMALWTRLVFSARASKVYRLHRIRVLLPTVSRFETLCLISALMSSLLRLIVWMKWLHPNKDKPASRAAFLKGKEMILILSRLQVMTPAQEVLGPSLPHINLRVKGWTQHKRRISYSRRRKHKAFENFPSYCKNLWLVLTKFWEHTYRYLRSCSRQTIIKVAGPCKQRYTSLLWCSHWVVRPQWINGAEGGNWRHVGWLTLWNILKSTSFKGWYLATSLQFWWAESIISSSSVTTIL